MKYSKRDGWHLVKMMLALVFSIHFVVFPAYSLKGVTQDATLTQANRSNGQQFSETLPTELQDRKERKRSSVSKQGSGQAKPENLNSDEPISKIAFASDRSDNFDIYVMNADGGGVTRLTTDPADDVSPSWSPDGTKIAFVSGRDGNPEIYVMNANGSNQTRLTTNPSDDVSPAFSPDGTKIAFVSNRTGHDQIFIMNADGSNQTNISNSPADDFGPAWRPDGAKLAFSSVRDGNAEIYTMDAADGANQTRLTNNADDDVNPTWSRGKITFDSFRDGNEQIYAMNADGSEQTRLTNNTAFDSDPARSADGAKIVFESTRDGNYEIYIANADGSNQKRLTNNPASDIEPSLLTVVTNVPARDNTIQFSQANYSVAENAGSVNITVTRTGDTSGVATVEVATVNGTASDVSDFTPLFRTLTFAAGETSKTVTIFIIDDALVENDETFSVTLSDSTGATLGSPSTATVTIIDNDGTPSATNPIDGTTFFVRQQYLDFLNRDADASGLNFWVNTLNALISNCNSQPSGDARRKCVLSARAQVSTAFFLSQEFQQTGFFVIRLYQEAFGRLPTLREFLIDVQEIGQGVVIGQPGASDLLEANRRAFVDEFVNRTAFKQRFNGVSNTNYVNSLFTNAGVDPVAEAATRDALIAGLNNGTETTATVLRKVGDTKSVFNALYNRAFVLMQYFGYLRRDPDSDGFNFWLNKLNSATLSGEDARDPNVAFARIKRAQIVEAFIDSTEYRIRFGVATRP